MQRKNPLKSWHCWKRALYMMMLLSIIIGTALIQEVKAQQMLRVWLFIEQADGGGCSDWEGDGPPDIYWDIHIDGQKQTTFDSPISSIFSPFPVNKQFYTDVDMSRGTIPISIEQWDKDWPVNEQCDIDPGDGKILNLDLNLATCAISGDASGTCGTSIYTGNDSARQFKFKITVDYPPHVEGLTVRCLHQRTSNGGIWPQFGGWVTITAEALDENANPITGTVEELEIWVDDQTAPQITTTSSSRDYLHYIPDQQHASSNEILYRCRAKTSGLWASSGWRTVQIGHPEQGRAVPILYTGYPSSKVDIVFIPDSSDYTGPDDPDFLADVHNIIRDSYYARDTGIRSGGRWFLFRQDFFNFWIAMDTGHAHDANSCGLMCNHDLPEDWDTVYSFVDSGAIVHTTSLRDFAQRDRRIFSAQTTAIDNFLHEAGHSPFGLADEYCCDSHYFQPEPHPNIYPNREACQDDELTSGIGDACRQIEDAAGNTIDWYRVESAIFLGNDLMDDTGDHTVRPADERRMNWYLHQCREGGC